jgi:hypothetical protein
MDKNMVPDSLSPWSLNGNLSDFPQVRKVNVGLLKFKEELEFYNIVCKLVLDVGIVKIYRLGCDKFSA